MCRKETVATPPRRCSIDNPLTSPTCSIIDSPIAVSPLFADFKKPTTFRTHHVKVSICLGFLIFVSSSVFAFLLGCAARIRLQLQVPLRVEVPLQHGADMSSKKSFIDLSHEGQWERMSLSPPKQRKEARKGLNVGDPVCYQVMVHPGMITNPNPKRVAMVGQEGGTLHEVMKHRSVTQVDMFYVSHEEAIIPTSIEGPSVTHRHVDSLPEASTDQSYDVIIMNYSDILSRSTSTVEDLYNTLTSDGILISPLDVRSAKKNVQLINNLREIGFMSIHVYEDGHCKFVEPRSMLVALKDYKTRSNWYRKEAELQIQLQQRIRGPINYVDAPTMLSYQVPSKATENIFCQDEEGEECNYRFQSLPADSVNIPASQLAVKTSTVSEMAGRGLFAGDHDIPRHATLGVELTVNNFCVMPSTWKIIDSIYENREERKALKNDLFEGLVYYILGYGYGSQLLGETQWTVDSWFSLFSNHGCNATFNFGTDDVTWSELTVSLDAIPRELDGSLADTYSPRQERHLREYAGGGDYTLRDIKAGEEILTNYLGYADPSEWRDEVLELRSQCAGEEAGEITNYESGDKQFF